MISAVKTRQQISKFLTSRHLVQSAWSVADVAVYPVLMFMTVGMFIDHLGTEQYGIWQLVNATIAALSVLNVGFGEATIRFVSKYRTENNLKAMSGVVSATGMAYAGIAILIALLGFVGGNLIEAGTWQPFSISPTNMPVAINALQIGCATFGLRLVEQIVLSALRGIERYDAASRLSIAGKIVLLVLNIIMVQQGYQLVQIFINSFWITLCTLVLEVFFLFRMVPGLQVSPALARPYWREISPYGFWSWMQSVMHIAGVQLDKFLVVSLAGVEVFAYYSIASLLAERINALLSASVGFVFPIIARRTERQDNLLKMFYKLNFVIITAGIGIAIGLFLLKDPVLGGLVLKTKYPAVNQYLPGFFLYVFLLAFTLIPYYFIMGSGKVRMGVYVRVVVLAGQFAFVPLAYRLGGSPYIPYGLGLMLLCMLPVQFYLLGRHILQTNAMRFTLQQWVLPAIAFLGVAGWQVLGQPVVALMLGLVASGLWYWLYFRPVKFIFK